MKLRESGMPEESYWETLFDVELILDRLGIDRQLGDVAELGCGYGTFSLPVAKRIGGVLHTFDIEPEMVERTRRRAAEARIQNIECFQRDVFMMGFDLATMSQDVCLLFNILHCEDPLRLLSEAAHIVKPSGFIHVIHWRNDPMTPRGPSLEIRPRPEQIAEWATHSGLLEKEDSVLDLPPWHYGLRFRRI